MSDLFSGQSFGICDDLLVGELVVEAGVLQLLRQLGDGSFVLEPFLLQIRNVVLKRLVTLRLLLHNGRSDVDRFWGRKN